MLSTEQCRTWFPSPSTALLQKPSEVWIRILLLVKQLMVRQVSEILMLWETYHTTLGSLRNLWHRCWVCAHSTLTLSWLATVAADAWLVWGEESDSGSRMSAGILATASSTSTMRGLSPSPRLPPSQESKLILFYTCVIVSYLIKELPAVSKSPSSDSSTQESIK